MSCRRSIGGAWSGGHPKRSRTGGTRRCSRRNTRPARDAAQRRARTDGDPRSPPAGGQADRAGGPAPAVADPPGHPPVPRGPRISVFPRSDVPVQIQWFPDPDSNQWVAVIDSGVNMIVDGLAGLRHDRHLDRPAGDLDHQHRKCPTSNGRTRAGPRTPLEIYMEGNVVFRQGERKIYADRMYYDVRNHVGTVLGADMLTPAPGYEGKLRLHADVLQQIGQDHFRAQDAYVTSSRLGEPRLSAAGRATSTSTTSSSRRRPADRPAADRPRHRPAGGRSPEAGHGQNNLVYIEEVPVFYWPTFATDLNDPTFFLRRVQIQGRQRLRHADPHRLGRLPVVGHPNTPEGTDLDLEPRLPELRGFGKARVHLRPRRFLRHSRARRRA